MAVVPMKKVLICGLKKDRKGTLELLQRQGVLEISNVLQEDDMLGRMDVTSSKTVFERNANIAEQAINILDRYAPEEKGMLSSFEGREVLSLDEYEANAGKHDEVMKKAYRLQELAKQIGEHSAAAVSYTHLDVYKRQPGLCSRRCPSLIRGNEGSVQRELWAGRLRQM